MSLNDDLFLEKLAAEVTPPRDSGMFQRYITAAAVLITVVLIMGFAATRPELASHFQQTDFLLQFCLWLGVLVCAGICAFVLATPRWPMLRGVRLTLWGSLFFLTAFGVWLMMNLPAHISEQHDTWGLACIAVVSGIGVLTACCITFALRGKARSTYPVLMGLMTALAGAGAGMVAVMLVCPHEEIAHAFVSHFVPALVVGLFVTLSGKSLWRW